MVDIVGGHNEHLSSLNTHKIGATLVHLGFKCRIRMYPLVHLTGEIHDGNLFSLEDFSCQIMMLDHHRQVTVDPPLLLNDICKRYRYSIRNRILPDQDICLTVTHFNSLSETTLTVLQLNY